MDVQDDGYEEGDDEELASDKAVATAPMTTVGKATITMTSVIMPMWLPLQLLLLTTAMTTTIMAMTMVMMITMMIRRMVEICGDFEVTIGC